MQTTFTVVMTLLLVALCVLGWLLMDQDRSLSDQRIREQLDTAAGLIVRSLTSDIGGLRSRLDTIAVRLAVVDPSEQESLLDSLRGPLTIVYFSDSGIFVAPQNSVRYGLTEPVSPPLPDEFNIADRLEFREQDLEAAMEILNPLARSGDRRIRAAATLRLARLNNRVGRVERALRYFEELAGLPDEYVGGVPADWLGIYARCEIFESEAASTMLESEVKRLTDLLTDGGRDVSATTYRYYVNASNSWRTGIETLAAIDGTSEAAAKLKRIWSDWRQGRASSSGARIDDSTGEYILYFWSGFQRKLAGGVMPVNELLSESLGLKVRQLDDAGIGWSISESGRDLIASEEAGVLETPSVRSLVIAGITLTISAFETPALLPNPADQFRRRLLLSALLLILFLVVSSTYFIHQSLRREAKVSRLQSDFVSAVSHEFRTPLTSIRQLTEMLASGRVKDSEKTEVYYGILNRESARLHRLVENLLDFGRMEAGAHPYHMERIECRQLLNGIARAFKEESGLDDETVSLTITGEPIIRADNEAISRVVWNLLENAVKYSPAGSRIWITSGISNTDDTDVTISVSDEGTGIAEHEQSDIFKKFVRGTAADASSAKGTGLGLAMVKKIVEDHGGSMSLESAPGKGSTFTIILPSSE